MNAPLLALAGAGLAALWARRRPVALVGRPRPRRALGLRRDGCSQRAWAQPDHADRVWEVPSLDAASRPLRVGRRPQRLREPAVRGPPHARDARRGHRQPGLERADPRRSAALPRRGRPRSGARVGALEPAVARDAARGGLSRAAARHGRLVRGDRGLRLHGLPRLPPALRRVATRPDAGDPARRRTTALPSAPRRSTATRRRRGAPPRASREAAGSSSA